MSCWIMCAEPMAAVANAAETLLNCGYDYFGFDPPDELITACADCCDDPRAHRPLYFAENIYRKLYAVNAAAYNGRYARMDDEAADDVAPVIDVSGYRVHRPYEYGDHHYIVQPWHYKLAMLLDFWIYQTSEDATRSHPLYLGMKSFRDALYKFIIRNSDEYRANQWGRL